MTTCQETDLEVITRWPDLAEGQSMSPAAAVLHCLPDAILETIFALLAPKFRSIDPAAECADILSHEDPARLSQVCTRWRNVALRLPWVWNKIRLHMKTPREDGRGLESLLTLWLQRSRREKLNVVLIDESPASFRSEGPLYRLLSLLSSSFSRCEHIYIRGHSECLLALECLSSAPSLRTFSFIEGTSSSQPHPHTLSPSLNFLQKAKKLRRLEIKVCQWASEGNYFPPLTKSCYLREVHLTGSCPSIAPSEWARLQTLFQSPDTRSITLNGIRTSDAQPPSSKADATCGAGVISLVKKLKLHLIASPSPSPPLSLDFFRTVTMPKLQQLVIRYQLDAPPRVPSFLPLLGRRTKLQDGGQCLSLKELTLVDVALESHKEISELLGLVVELRVLKILFTANLKTSHTFAGSLIAGLKDWHPTFVDLEYGHRCKKLERLTVVNYFTDIDERMVRHLAARATHETLRYVTIGLAAAGEGTLRARAENPFGSVPILTSYVVDGAQTANLLRNESKGIRS